MNKNSFLQKLVKSTIGSEPTVGEQKTGLFEYFEQKRQDIDLRVIGKWVPELCCFRIEYNGSVIDLPKNWSFFTKLEEEVPYRITVNHDPYHLICFFNDLGAKADEISVTYINESACYFEFFHHAS